MLRKLIFWRWNPRLFTYSNGLLLVMFISGITLWTSNAESSTAVRDIQLFTENRIGHEFVAAGMIIAAAGGLFRDWHPHELLMVFIPYFFFVFIIGFMTFTLPAPSRPLARLWTWLFPVFLTTFYQAEKIIKLDVD